MGQALVEFAFVLPVALLFLVGLFDSARAVWLSNTLAAATREATRYAAVHGSSSADPATASDVEAVLARHAVGIGTMTVSVTWPDGDARRGSTVTVIATSAFVPALSQAILGGGLNVTLRGSSTMVIHQ